MKKLLLCGLIAVTSALSAPATDAAFTFTINQVGNDVVIDGSGTLNTAALTDNSGGIAFPTGITPANATLITGPVNGQAQQIYYRGGLTGPASFGTGGSTAESTGSGSIVGVYGGGNLVLLFTPTGYVSNSLLTDTATYAGQSLATLGIAPGTYTYTWGTAAGNFDSLTINAIVPEPSTWALLGMGAASVGVVTLRRRRTRA